MNSTTRHTIVAFTTALLLAPLDGLWAEDMSGTPAKSVAPHATYSVKAAGLTINFDEQGRIAGSSVAALTGQTQLDGCTHMGDVMVKKVAGGGIAFTRKMADDKGHQAKVTDRFTPTKDSIRWEVEIVSEGVPWTTPVKMHLKVPSSEQTRFWTSWVNTNAWTDPLQSVPMADCAWDYGGGQNTICIPIASMLKPNSDSGVSLAIAPDQPLLHLRLVTKPDGTMLFWHKYMRFGEGRKVTLTTDIVTHEADWRGGLRWMVSRYPEFFNPPNPRADAMAGTCSYSHRKEQLTPAETDRLRKMAYRCDWDASFDWPYFGMYLPPMADADACWETSGHNSAGNRDPNRVTQMSWRKINEKGRVRKESGLFTLAYFNVTEFGSQIKDASAVKTNLPDREVWRDANAFLYRQIPDGIYRDEKGNTAGTWSGAVAMDSGGPAFQAFLLEQAARHVNQLPDYDGIAIDRMDWLPRVNYSPDADDHTGWYLNGRPGRFLGLSWIDTLSKLGPIMHRKDKVIFVNCNFNSHRLDYVREVDGFWDEQGDNGYDFNGSCLLALRKPALMWTHNAGCLKADPDSYFQRHLYMGAYPTAPFPGNDHTILPDPKADRWYLDYGPLLDPIRGKKWVLAPHCVESDVGKVNLFEVPVGYALPVTFAGKAESVTVRVRNIPGLDKLKCDALHPGIEKPLMLTSKCKDGTLELTVPVVHGCAIVLLRNP